ncbi:MAG: chorismate pyruvate-lyase family protein [Candidatus Korobacteraceae bacterium]
MSAIDILGNLDGFDVNSLEPLQRVLLVTDGTLTEILEAIFFERVRLVKVSQRIIPATASHALLDPTPGEALIERKILLQGVKSNRNYVYAESLIAVDRLSQSFRDELLNSGTPLGRLWLEHKLETFKELQEIRCQRAEVLGQYFECAEGAPLLARTYRVLSAGRPVMVITEYFPAIYQYPAKRTGRTLDQMVGASQ